MISNPTPKFTSQIRLIRSVFARNRTGTGSEKIDRNRISGRTLPMGEIPKYSQDFLEQMQYVGISFMGILYS